jgi:hypothetical protein
VVTAPVPLDEMTTKATIAPIHTKEPAVKPPVENPKPGGSPTLPPPVQSPTMRPAPSTGTATPTPSPVSTMTEIMRRQRHISNGDGHMRMSGTVRLHWLSLKKRLPAIRIMPMPGTTVRSVMKDRGCMMRHTTHIGSC